jgi:quinol monooxygenase YgiN
MRTILLAALLALNCSTFAQEAAEHPFVKEIASKLSDPKKKFTLLVRLTVKDGEAEKFIAAFAEAVEPTRKEDGCSRYELNQIAGEKSAFVIYERWTKLEKMAAHLETPHTKKLLETVTPLLEGAPEIVVLTPQGEPVRPKAVKEETESK